MHPAPVRCGNIMGVRLRVQARLHRIYIYINAANPSSCTAAEERRELLPSRLPDQAVVSVASYAIFCSCLRWNDLMEFLLWELQSKRRKREKGNEEVLFGWCCNGSPVVSGLHRTLFWPPNMLLEVWIWTVTLRPLYITSAIPTVKQVCRGTQSYVTFLVHVVDDGTIIQCRLNWTRRLWLDVSASQKINKCALVTFRGVCMYLRVVA